MNVNVSGFSRWALLHGEHSKFKLTSNIHFYDSIPISKTFDRSGYIFQFLFTKLTTDRSFHVYFQYFYFIWYKVNTVNSVIYQWSCTILYRQYRQWNLLLHTLLKALYKYMSLNFTAFSRFRCQHGPSFEYQLH